MCVCVCCRCSVCSESKERLFPLSDSCSLYSDKLSQYSEQSEGRIGSRAASHSTHTCSNLHLLETRMLGLDCSHREH